MKTLALLLALSAPAFAFDAPLYRLPEGFMEDDFPRIEAALRTAKFKVEGFTVITRNGKQTLYVRWKDGGESKDPTPVLAPLLPKTAAEEAALRQKVLAGTSTPQEERRLLILLLSK